jgi:hypothetical protein
MRHLYCTASKAEVPFLVEVSAQDRARRGNIPKAFAFESAQGCSIGALTFTRGSQK